MDAAHVGASDLCAVLAALARFTMRMEGAGTSPHCVCGTPQSSLPPPQTPASQIKFAGIMQYDGELKLPTLFLVPPPLIENASEQYLVGSGLRIFACSESQKIGRASGRGAVAGDSGMGICGNNLPLPKFGGSSWVPPALPRPCTSPARGVGHGLANMSQVPGRSTASSRQCSHGHLLTHSSDTLWPPQMSPFSGGQEEDAWGGRGWCISGGRGSISRTDPIQGAPIALLMQEWE